MPFVPLIIVAILALLLLAGSSYAQARAAGKAPLTTSTITVQQVSSLSKQIMEEMLGKLEKKEEPQPKMGAMCYEMVASAERAEYVCPTCGEKTLYSRPQSGFIERELPGCRREFEAIKKNSSGAMKLDESSFCKKCSPNAKGAALGLFITYSDGTKHGITPVTQQDLRLLRDFLNNKGSYTTLTDGEMPLKKELPRLRQLLGLPQVVSPK